ncbi:dnaJ homolog subfamily B member 5 [Engraulis encrasicolus]|uniref:dnaJ homolog subfamily B member 5 n=1 Tax=Engraulis encrasicolus TaxID=184585 RepID=UPI002FD39DFC
MVLIWTQFGVKHKNVKCKVRVIHSEDSHSSEETAEECEVPVQSVAPVKDYYSLLGVTTESNEDEIRRAYHKLALRYHPDKNPEEDAAEKFKEIREAYDVLTDPQKRNQYDRRDACMKRPATKGDSSPPAKTHSSSGRFFNIDIDAGDFSDLFNPFLHTAFTRANGSGGHSGGHSSSSSSGATSSGGSGGSGSSSANGGSAVPSSKVLELEVSLEELLTGVTKHVRLSTGAGSGGSASAQEHVMNVEVKKGWHEGTRITFPGAGLKAGGGSSSGGGGGGGAAQDIVFVVKEKKHSHFRREGSNLLYTAEITLREALCGCTVTVPTLDGGKKPLPCSDIIKPGSTRRLIGEGLPRSKCPTQRGDLLVKFEVLFPDRIPPPSKEIIRHSLGQC